MLKLEIVANYPFPLKIVKGKKVHSGTFHAYVMLPGGWDIDFRGIYYRYVNKKFFIRYPSRKGEVDGKECQYCLYSFMRMEKQKELTRCLIRALYEFYEKNEFAQSEFISEPQLTT